MQGKLNNDERSGGTIQVHMSMSIQTESMNIPLSRVLFPPGLGPRKHSKLDLNMSFRKASISV